LSLERLVRLSAFYLDVEHLVDGGVGKGDQVLRAANVYGHFSFLSVQGGTTGLLLLGFVNSYLVSFCLLFFESKHAFLNIVEDVKKPELHVFILLLTEEEVGDDVDEGIEQEYVNCNSYTREN